MNVGLPSRSAAASAYRPVKFLFTSELVIPRLAPKAINRTYVLRVETMRE